MDQLFTGSGYDISHACSILGIKLSGSACTNVLHNIRNAQSWAEIRTTLVRELSDTPDMVDLITAFRQLCQNGRSIQDYNTQFCEFLFCTKSITDTDDIDLLQRYCDGLDDEYEAFCTKQVAKMRDHTVHLSEIMDHARKFTLNSKILPPQVLKYRLLLPGPPHRGRDQCHVLTMTNRVPETPIFGAISTNVLGMTIACVAVTECIVHNRAAVLP